MGQANTWARCTAQRGSGHFCDGDPLPEAPFPICIEHAAAVMRYVSQVVEKSGVAEVDNAMELLRRFHIFGVTVDYDAPTTEDPEKPYQVYYLELDGLIKIGYTTNLKRRLTQYPPMTRGSRQTTVCDDTSPRWLPRPRNSPRLAVGRGCSTKAALLPHLPIAPEWRLTRTGLAARLRCR